MDAATPAAGGDVQLHDLAAVAAARVAKLEREGEDRRGGWVGDSDRTLGRRERPVLERGVREAVAEREDGLHALREEVAVADMQSLAVDESAWVRGEVRVRRAILGRGGEGFGELAGRARRAEEQVGEGEGACLAREVGLEHRRHAAKPRHQHRRPIGEHDDAARLGGCHRGDEAVHLLGEAHVAPVEPLRLELVRQAGEDDRRVRAARRRHRLVDERVVERRVPRLVPRRVHQRAATALDGGSERVERSVESVRVDLRGARALVPRRRREPADERHPPAARPERQQLPVVLEQDRRLGGGAARERVVARVHLLALLLGGVRRLGRVALQVQRHHPRRRAVQHALLQRARPHGRRYPRVVDAGRRGHLEVDAGEEALDAVGDRAPVREEEPLEAPLAPQQRVVQPVVLRALLAVEPVVGAHDCPRLRARDGRLKGGQIDLPQRALVDLRVDRHAVGLLVVGRKVLDRRAHPLTLHALDKTRRKLAREQRVLGKVLEVPAAERVALDVDARAEQHAHAQREALAPERLAHQHCQRRVPRGCERASAREARRWRRAVQPEV
mmetsp:Transcript_24754/g.74957  ORF Transcript_24754/g.74957 Transcript_24754/m.74957 type:complete len:559 (-) Transcript_24754:259-1935(-)